MRLCDAAGGVATADAPPLPPAEPTRRRFDRSSCRRRRWFREGSAARSRVTGSSRGLHDRGLARTATHTITGHERSATQQLADTAALSWLQLDQKLSAMTAAAALLNPSGCRFALEIQGRLVLDGVSVVTVVPASER